MDISVSGGALQGPYMGTDQYGLVLSNSQGGEVRGSYYAGKHAVQMGGGADIGSVPTTNITVYAFGQGSSGATANQDVHGNTRGCTFIGGVYHNGGQISGQRHKYIGCTFMGYGNSGVSLYGGEIVRGEFLFSSCVFHSTINPNTNNRGVIDISNLSNKVSGDCTIMFSNCSLNAPASTGFPISLGLNGSNYNISLLFDGLALVATGTGQFIRCNKSGGSGAVDTLRVKGISGLPDNAHFFFGATGSPTINKCQLPDQAGEVVITPSTSAASATLTVAFRNPYPKAPIVIAGCRGQTMGGKRFIAGASGVTGGSFTASGGTPDGSNFTNTNDGVVAWVAKLDEL